MNIVFLAGLFPDELKKEIEDNSKSTVQYAANSLQWNFVRGLDENNIKPIKIINAPLVGSFPVFYKKLFITKKEFSHKVGLVDVSVGYCNLALIKNYFIKNALFNELKYWYKQNPEGLKLVVVYGMLPSWVLAAIKFKRKYSNIKLCLVVPDLPEFMNNSKSIVSKIRDYFKPNLYPHIPVFDSFVFLTDEMANHFNVRDTPWVKIEGMINPDEVNFEPIHKILKKKIVMYSGTLAERYGILDLIDAFESIIDPNYELWICGSGNTAQLIKSKALTDNRIKYFGLIPREDVLELQRKATVLVNPRDSNGEYTKFSFPSKIMEYLLSGTPCIIKRLPGIPVEYYNYLFIVKDNELLSLSNKIIEVCNLTDDYIKNFSESAKKFVLEQKNYRIQTKKMVSMLQSLIGHKL